MHVQSNTNFSAIVIGRRSRHRTWKGRGASLRISSRPPPFQFISPAPFGSQQAQTTSRHLAFHSAGSFFYKLGRALCLLHVQNSLKSLFVFYYYIKIPLRILFQSQEQRTRCPFGVAVVGSHFAFSSYDTKLVHYATDISRSPCKRSWSLEMK